MSPVQRAPFWLVCLLLAGCAQNLQLPPAVQAVIKPPARRPNAVQTVQRPDARNPTSARVGPGTDVLDLGPYSGAPRWGFDKAFAEQIAKLHVFVQGEADDGGAQTGGDPKQALQLFTLGLERHSVVTLLDISGIAMGDPGKKVLASLLDCEYSRQTATPFEVTEKRFRREFIKVFYWLPGTRKVLTPYIVKQKQYESSHIADMELGTCPANFVSALELGFGPGVWGATQTAQQALDAWQRRLHAAGRSIDYTGWDKNTKALTPAQDRALAQELDAALRDLESRRAARRLDVEDLGIVRNKKLQPAMAKLAASGLAQARTIPSGETGRKAFERWDAGIGHTVVGMAMRFHSFKNPGDLFVEVLDAYLQAYEQQLADKGTLDRAYLKSMLASIEKYKEQEAAAAAQREPASTSTVWVMRPRQSALYRKLNQGITLVQAYSKARADNERFLATLDQDIKSSRTAFWACYEKRCPEGGVLYHRFSAYINARDRFDIQRTAWEGAMARTVGDRFDGVFSQLMGMDKQVDTQYIGACDHHYDRFLARFTNLMATPNTIKARVEEGLNGDDYLQVQQCRDRLEFILRPRSSPAGLL